MSERPNSTRIRHILTFIATVGVMVGLYMALVYAGIIYAGESWSYMPYGFTGPRGEISINSPIGVPVSPLKTILPVASAVLLLQGIAETIRCVQCLKRGEWPARLHDVEEMEEMLIKQHQKEEAERAAQEAAQQEEAVK